MKSSSFININGDLKQNKFTIILYLFLNFLQNIYYSLFKKKFRFINFVPSKKKYFFKNDQSISRKLCGVFWKNINWNILNYYLGKFNICEIGPGDGNYFKKDISIKKKLIKKYTGYDVVENKNWKKQNKKNFILKKFDGYSFQKIISKNNNLFLSQSCLEHVRYDLKFFHDIKKKFKKSKKKSILIKCVPSPFCLFTYLTHGYRQYNTKNLNKISNVLGSDNLFVIKLGSFFLNLEHLKNTTLPLIYKKKDMMKSQNKFYYNKINNLIVKNKTGSLFFSSFIIMIGFINFNKVEKQDVIKKIFS